MNPNIPGHSGTTSACAENTDWGAAGTPLSGNYLRVRGEYFEALVTKITSTELPPRARRIRSTSTLNLNLNGTTSACAENTQQLSITDRIKRNYLRVRGEYIEHLPSGEILEELPPRARRIPSTARPIKPWGGNYLRVRGEYPFSGPHPDQSQELPPRARRIHLYSRNQPAHNGNYLRVRGEYPK